MKFFFITALLLTQISLANTETVKPTETDSSDVSAIDVVKLSAPGEAPIVSDEVVIDLSTVKRMPTEVIDSRSNSINEELLEAQVSHSFNQENLDQQFSELE